MDNLLINSRIEKLKSLGFLGYSLYIDGTLTLPEMSNTIIDIKRLLSAPGNGFHTTYVVNEAAVNEKLTELGCVCYNLYVDKRINNVNVELTSLCELISSINRQIYVQPQVAEPLPLTVATSSTAEEIAPTMAESMTAEEIAPTAAEPVTAPAQCPPGFELIPTNPKICLCGYKNSQRANFCGKCGLKL